MGLGLKELYVQPLAWSGTPRTCSVYDSCFYMDKPGSKSRPGSSLCHAETSTAFPFDKKERRELGNHHEESPSGDSHLANLISFNSQKLFQVGVSIPFYRQES